MRPRRQAGAGAQDRPHRQRPGGDRLAHRRAGRRARRLPRRLQADRRDRSGERAGAVQRGRWRWPTSRCPPATGSPSSPMPADRPRWPPTVLEAPACAWRAPARRRAPRCAASCIPMPRWPARWTCWAARTRRSYRRALDAVLADPGCDGVLAILVPQVLVNPVAVVRGVRRSGGRTTAAAQAGAGLPDGRSQPGGGVRRGARGRASRPTPSRRMPSRRSGRCGGAAWISRLGETSRSSGARIAVRACCRSAKARREVQDAILLRQRAGGRQMLDAAEAALCWRPTASPRRRRPWRPARRCGRVRRAHRLPGGAEADQPRHPPQDGRRRRDPERDGRGRPCAPRSTTSWPVPVRRIPARHPRRAGAADDLRAARKSSSASSATRPSGRW